jgi:uncharacterized repeat protein (TIGR03803 family)
MTTIKQALIGAFLISLSIPAFAQAPILIGTASAGGAGSAGTIYYVPTGASSPNFATSVPGGANGATPMGSATKAPNGKFYGMVNIGGTNNVGGIYEFGYTGPYNLKYSFVSSQGSNPNGALLMANNGLLYGLTRTGGIGDAGALFSYTPGAGSITTLKSFSSPTGTFPNGSLIQASDNKLYGLTSSGGSSGYGTLFSYDIGTNTLTVLHNFITATDGGAPKGSLIQLANGKMYGLTSAGGSGSAGTIFEFDPAGPTYTVLHNFNSGANGGNPEGDLAEGGTAGHLWGMTKTGGAYGYGTIFEYVLGGGFTRWFDFQNGLADGGQPSGSLFLSGYNGNFYGVTNSGGLYSAGTFFEFTQTGSFSKKFDFQSGVNGANPVYVKLLEYLPLDASINGTNVLCNGMGTGSATVTAGGGTPPYTYSWAPSGGTAVTATGLASGNYTCTITEAGGYQITRTINITQPPPLVDNTNTTNVLCNGMSTGSATITPSGGTPGYTFTWNPPMGISPTVTNLAAGSYTSIVTDVNGCTASYPFSVSEPTALTVTFNSVWNVGCFGGNDGSADITASGGTPGYSYNWTSGGTGTLESGLVAGNYSVTVTDANGCTNMQPFTITEPAQLDAIITPNDVLCYGGNSGAGSVSPFGGTPSYYYYWSPSGGTGATEINLYAGSYTCTISDNNGCTINRTMTVAEPPPLLGAGSSTDVTCFGAADGTANTSPTGGVLPYTYSWSPSGQTTATATGVGPGSYTVTVTDANGCSILDFATVNEPTQLDVSPAQTFVGCAGTSSSVANAGASGGTTPYSYSWTTGGTAPNEVNMPAGNYTVTVTDNNGCTGNGNGTISENASTDLSGAITANTLNITAGTVYAIKQQSSVNGIDTVASINIIAGSPNTYTFTGLQADNYYIKVIADTALFPTAVPTYYGNEFQWDSSTVVTHGCAVNEVADIDVIELLPPGGTGFVSGFVFEGVGYQGLRIAPNGGNHPYLPCVPGGPLKGIDVKLGKNPGGGIQARVMTDTSGYFEFGNVPDGNYTIYVDIPNLPMDSMHIVTISGGDSTVQNNYIADSLMIFVIDTTGSTVGIYSSSKVYDNKFTVYPNPAKDDLFVYYELNKAGDITVELSNALGQSIKTEAFKNEAAGEFKHRIDISSLHLQAGVYFISIQNDNRKYTQRLVVIE